MIYNLIAEGAGAKVEKTVSKDGGETYAENVSVNPGDKVSYKVELKNTGKTTLNDVNLKDILPTGISFVEGSAKYYAADSTTAENMADTLTTSGYSVGSVAAGKTVSLVYEATVDSNAACGNLVNKISVTHDSDNEVSDGATVKVENCTASVTELPSTGATGILLGAVLAGAWVGMSYRYAQKKHELETMTVGKSNKKTK